MPAGHERLHLLEQLRLAPEDADAARAAHLVAGDGDEVDAERLHVELHVRRRLRGVADEDRALLVRPRDELVERVDRPERVRDEAGRDDLDVALARERVEAGEVELAVLVERQEAQLGAASSRAMYCHGTKFEWCSSSVTTTRSPGWRFQSPHAYATRLIASVALRTKMILARRRRVEEGARPLARVLERPRSRARRARRRRDGRSRTTSRRSGSSPRASGAASASSPPSRGRRAACRGTPARRSGNPRAACVRRASYWSLRPRASW